MIGIELSDGARQFSGQLNYDLAGKSIVSALGKACYQRRLDNLSEAIRKTLAGGTH